MVDLSLIHARDLLLNKKVFRNENFCVSLFDVGLSTAASVIERYIFIDNQEEDGNLYKKKKTKEDITDFPVLRPGKICWKKIRASPKGKPGCNDWWSAMLMVVLYPRVKTNPHTRALGIN